MLSFRDSPSTRTNTEVNVDAAICRLDSSWGKVWAPTRSPSFHVPQLPRLIEAVKLTLFQYCDCVGIASQVRQT